MCKKKTGAIEGGTLTLFPMINDHICMSDWIIYRDTFTALLTPSSKFYYTSYITCFGYFYVVMIIIIQSHLRGRRTSNYGLLIRHLYRDAHVIQLKRFEPFRFIKFICKLLYITWFRSICRIFRYVNNSVETLSVKK